LSVHDLSALPNIAFVVVQHERGLDVVGKRKHLLLTEQVFQASAAFRLFRRFFGRPPLIPPFPFSEMSLGGLYFRRNFRK